MCVSSSGVLRPFAMATIIGLSFTTVGHTGGGPCPIVDRGSPIDGVTTISVLAAPAACVDGPLWEGWTCALVRSAANDNGVTYDIDVRWNLVDEPVEGTFTWMIGGGSTGSMREQAPTAATAQDALADDGIRTIELRFLGAGTQTAPRNGFVNVSAVYADVLEHLVATGVATGVLGHYGNSGGSMMGANAVAYHSLERVLDGIVLGGGPFWTDLEAVCTDPSSPIFADLHLRETTDDWNWKELGGEPYCAMMSPVASPPYGCRSTLGTASDSEHPTMIVAVIVGTEDKFNPWMDASALAYFHAISAREKTFDRPGAPHLVVASEEGAQLVRQRILEIVDAGPVVGIEPVPQPPGDALAVAPNPFRGTTWISVSSDGSGGVALDVFDSSGRRVRRLLARTADPGPVRVAWDGHDDRGRRLHPGIYFVRIDTRPGVPTRRVVLVR